MVKKTLKKGDAVSLQSLSGGMAGDSRFLHRFLIGKSRIKDIGLKTSVSKNALKGIEYISQNPQKRADDLMDAIFNKEIKMIIANIGGFDSHKIIPFLDLEKIQQNPKSLLGYSDITSLHLLFYSLGIQTYYGPTVLSGFAENVEMHELTKESFIKTIFSNQSQEIRSSDEWTSTFLDWANEDFNNTKREMKKEKHNHIWLNFNENVKGHLIGGCLDTIISIKNEDFFPELKLWDKSIMFLETSEQHISPKEFEKGLDLLEKEINSSNAVIFGKPKDEKYFDEYLEIIKRKISIPVIFNLNFGHTAPFYTIPYGGLANVDFENKKIFISK